MYWRSSGPNVLEQVAEVADEREVVQDRAAALEQVVAGETRQCEPGSLLRRYQHTCPRLIPQG